MSSHEKEREQEDAFTMTDPNIFVLLKTVAFYICRENTKYKKRTIAKGRILKETKM